MDNLFTYGSLMCNDIMAKVAGYQADSTPATLNGFARFQIRNQEYPGIVPQEQSQIAGILYRQLPPEALRRLDLFEGELYERQLVEVKTEAGERSPAMVYVVKPQYRNRLSGEEWSFDRFLAEGKRKFELNYGGFDQL